MKKITPVHVAIAIVAVMLTYRFWPRHEVANLGSRGTEIIAFGDSLTAGYGASPGEDYPTKLSSMIGKQVINAGVSGDTTSSAAARLDQDVLARNPRIVIVGLGGNDFLRHEPVESTEANLRSIVRRVQAKGAMVVILGFRFPTLGRDYGDMYEDVAGDEHCLYVPDLLDGILSEPRLKSDEIHPNGAGYELMATRVSGPLRKLIAKADAR